MLPTHTKPTMARTLLLLLASFCLFTSLSAGGGTCKSSGILKCRGKSYPQYRCSPPVTSSTQALLTLNHFREGGAGLGPSECDGKFHLNSESVVGLSTGWYNKGSMCWKMIRITALNGRSTTAKVVEECDSASGCGQLPCRNNVLDGSKAVWDALGLDTDIGEENVTWSMAPSHNSGVTESPHLPPLPQPPLATGRSAPTDHSRTPAITTSNHWTWQKKVIIGVTGAVMGGLLIVCCFTCKLSRWPKKFWLTTQSNQDIEAFLKNNGALTLKRYKFSLVKKMTNSFQVKLGQGGFGAVYKGKLPDGSNVAVKMLNPSKGKGEEFINEVASISRTSHINVVTLLGFCIEGRKKALIYEYMSNGSLDKFIYKKGHENTPSLTLSWDNLYQIAVGIARGLEYLHKGCNTRILHFDIKPHNILLDENFCPKISDFGLAKLCPRKESIISMSDARGTVGYVAPEVCNRHFGGVSHKSDVYSYGMMLLEIVGGTKNINAEATQTSEIYFPDWIYKRLEQDTHLGLEEVSIEENEVIKRMTMVGLWCIQTIPNDRPTMSRVVDMLEGNINSLEMPPKPVLSSPIRSMTASSTTVD